MRVMKRYSSKKVPGSFTSLSSASLPSATAALPSATAPLASESACLRWKLLFTLLFTEEISIYLGNYDLNWPTADTGHLCHIGNCYQHYY